MASSYELTERNLSLVRTLHQGVAELLLLRPEQRERACVATTALEELIALLERDLERVAVG